MANFELFRRARRQVQVWVNGEEVEADTVTLHLDHNTTELPAGIEVTTFGDPDRTFLINANDQIRMQFQVYWDEAAAANAFGLEDPEARAAREKRQKLAAQKLARAEKRARLMLSEFLSKQQWDDLNHHGAFEVKTRKHRYRFTADGTVNDLCPRCRTYMCIHTGYNGLPPSDQILAKIMLINADEAAFQAIANTSWTYETYIAADRGRRPIDHDRGLREALATVFYTTDHT